MKTVRPTRTWTIAREVLIGLAILSASVLIGIGITLLIRALAG